MAMVLPYCYCFISQFCSEIALPSCYAAGELHEASLAAMMIHDEVIPLNIRGLF